MMYTKESWDTWLSRELLKYPKITKDGKETLKYGGSTYLHLDQFYWLPANINELHSIVSDPTVFKSYEFLPFFKEIIKTPRYKHSGKEDKELAPGEKKYIIKTKKRPITYACHRDAMVLSYFGYRLTEIYQEHIKEIGISECVSAYRSDTSKCNIQYSKEVFDFIKTKEDCSVIAIDIKGYFDTIDHLMLKKRWKEMLEKRGGLTDTHYKLFKILTDYHYINKQSLLKNLNIDLNSFKKEKKRPKHLLSYIPGINLSSKMDYLKKSNLILSNNNKDRDRQFGIPQGSSLSGVLSNIYLSEFDQTILKYCNERGFLYRRYCDDIIIVCDYHNENNILSLLNQLLDNHFLSYQPEKTELIRFAKISKRLRAYDGKKLDQNGVLLINNKNPIYYKSLQYLGFTFDGKTILIRPASLSRYFKRMQKRIIKNVNMAYSDNSKSDIIFTRKTLHRYSHLGKRNFLRYAYNASLKFYSNKDGERKEGMSSNAIRRQLKNHYEILVASLNSKNWLRRTYKESPQANKGKFKYINRREVKIQSQKN